jgi:hypothetical protein
VISSRQLSTSTAKKSAPASTSTCDWRKGRRAGSLRSGDARLDGSDEYFHHTLVKTTANRHKSLQTHCNGKTSFCCPEHRPADLSITVNASIWAPKRQVKMSRTTSAALRAVRTDLGMFSSTARALAHLLVRGRQSLQCCGCDRECYGHDDARRASDASGLSRFRDSFRRVVAEAHHALFGIKSV